MEKMKQYRMSGLTTDPTTLRYGLTISEGEFRNKEAARNWFGSHFCVPDYMRPDIRVVKLATTERLKYITNNVAARCDNKIDESCQLKVTRKHNCYVDVYCYTCDKTYGVNTDQEKSVRDHQSNN